MIRFFFFQIFNFLMRVLEKKTPATRLNMKALTQIQDVLNILIDFFLATILAFQKASTFFHMNIIMHFKELFFPLPKMQFRKKISCFNNKCI